MKQLALALTALLFFGCKKESAIDRTPELLAKSWKLTAMDVITPLQGTPLAGQSSNWYAPGTCYSEMLWTFKSDGNLVIKEAPSCIPPESTGVHSSVWTLTNGNKEITISGSPFGNFTYSIMSLTPAKLVVRRNEHVGYGGGSINLIIQREYTAQ